MQILKISVMHPKVTGVIENWWTRSRCERVAARSASSATVP